jgi:hypothetical protein
VKRPNRPVYEPPLPSEHTRRLTINVSSGDAVLICRCLSLIAERCERTNTRLRGLAPELLSRAGRLRRIAATVDQAVAEVER